MTLRLLAALSLTALAAAGCVMPRTPLESAARRSTWPADTGPALASAGSPAADWPSVKGDILRGTSPADLAKARAAVSQPLTEALTKP